MLKYLIFNCEANDDLIFSPSYRPWWYYAVFKPELTDASLSLLCNLLKLKLRFLKLNLPFQTRWLCNNLPKNNKRWSYQVFCFTFLVLLVSDYQYLKCYASACNVPWNKWWLIFFPSLSTMLIQCCITKPECADVPPIPSCKYAKPILHNTVTNIWCLC